MLELRCGLDRYFAFYNGETLHPSLDYWTSTAVYEVPSPRECSESFYHG